MGHSRDVVALAAAVTWVVVSLTRPVAAAAAAAAAVPRPGPLTQYVNVFVGTGQTDANFTIDPGNVFAGAAVPFGLVKTTAQINGYAPAGYVSNSPAKNLMRGISPLHDSGTGSSAGSYGQFCIQPVVCAALADCPVLEGARDQQRVGNGEHDMGFPGYMNLTLVNRVTIELASTQAASIEAYHFPPGAAPTLVLDWTDDSAHSFLEGRMTWDATSSRLTMNGTWRSSFGPNNFEYTAFQCVDLSSNGPITERVFWGGNTNGMDARRSDWTDWVLPRIAERRARPDFVQPLQAGALVRLSPGGGGGGDGNTVVVRRGLSFTSMKQACANLETELPATLGLAQVVAASNALWEDKLQRFTLADGTSDYVRRLFYSSLYRTFLSPNNATGNAPPPYSDTPHPYFDGLYCSWDTYRTLWPLMALASPRDFAAVADSYVDGWRREGWLPECRANHVRGFVQGGNNGVPIVADFVVKYARHAAQLGVNMDDFWAALHHDVSAQPPNWDWAGRRQESYQALGYVAYDWLDNYATGQRTREASRGLEYAFGDFTAGMAARALGHDADAGALRQRSLSYRHNYNLALESDGFRGFVAQRRPDGAFLPSNPLDCSPADNNATHDCSTQSDNTFGVYESSSWEYSLYAPHDVAGLIQLLGSGRNDTAADRALFARRLAHFFSAGYYLPGNEPSFQTPALFHYAGQPGQSVRQVRRVVYDHFNLSSYGIPGNDDNAAMASLLCWYLLGLYPVPGTEEMLVLSPFMPGFQVHNELLGTATVVVTGFDPRGVGLSREVPQGVRAFVDTVRLDGKPIGRCTITMSQLFGARHVEFVMTDQEKEGCGGPEPSSVSTGGFH